MSPATPWSWLRPLAALAAIGLGVLGLSTARACADEERALGSVRWSSEAAQAGRRLAARWPDVVSDVSQQLGLSPSLEGAEVVVVRGYEELCRQARVEAPLWAAAVTVGGQRIVLRDDVPTSVRATLEETLRHEAVHLIWARAAGPRAHRLPRWFEEGLAETVGGGVSVSAGARVEVAAALGRLLEFANLERAFPTAPEQADLAYQQSRRWVEHLVARKGWAGVREVLANVLAGPSDVPPSEALSRALRSATLHDLGEWHGEWQLTLRERGGRWWLWLLTDLGGVLLALLAVLGAALFATVRRRRRRQMASLPDEPDGSDAGHGAGPSQPLAFGGPDPEEPRGRP